MQGRNIRQSAESHPLLKVKATATENRSWRMEQARELTYEEVRLQRVQSPAVACSSAVAAAAAAAVHYPGTPLGALRVPLAAAHGPC
jgi:hypothetical protein